MCFSNFLMQHFKTFEMISLLDLLWNLADASLAVVSGKDGISQFLLTCGMTLRLSKYLCVSFEKFAGIEINLGGEKGDFILS